MYVTRKFLFFLKEEHKKLRFLELYSFEEILHRTNCDVITGCENGLHGEMSWSSATTTQNRLKFWEPIVLTDMQLAGQKV